MARRSGGARPRRGFALLIALLAALAAAAEARRPRRPSMGPWRGAARVAGASSGASPLAASPLDGPLKHCEERWRAATLDHFSWSAPEVPGARTFNQRFFVCARKRWRAPDGPIFLYVGNEADVTL